METILSFFISDAYAQAAPAGRPGPGVFDMALIAAMFIGLYFILIRPQQKRVKEHKAMTEALAKGDEVVTNGGMLGRITKAGDTFITLEIASGVEIQVQRQAIHSLMPKGTYKS